MEQKSLGTQNAKELQDNYEKSVEEMKSLNEKWVEELKVGHDDSLKKISLEWKTKEEQYLAEIASLKLKIKELEALIQNDYIQKLTSMSLAIAHSKEKERQMMEKILELTNGVDSGKTETSKLQA